MSFILPGVSVMRRLFQFFFLFVILFHWNLFSETSLFLRDNLKLAQPGDFIVISNQNTDTMMYMREKKGNILTVEEIAIPENKRKKHLMSWKEWVRQEAPDHTSWVLYDLDLQTGQMLRYYSFTKKGWYDIPEADNFLFKLLNLKFSLIPDSQRKRVGPRGKGPDFRPLWQPVMKIDGKVIKGVAFDAWQTRWPKDGGDLSGKSIEVYLPQQGQSYPSYFPYWLQISGAIGKAKIRIIDSGYSLYFPKRI